MTMQEFIKQSGLTMTTDPITERSDGLMSDSQMSHYQVGIRCDGRSMNLYYSMGSAHTEPPTLGDVLDCLKLDAASIEYADDLNDWLAEMGYDANEMPHGEFLYQERVYKVVASQAQEFESLLGSEAWEILRDDVESL